MKKNKQEINENEEEEINLIESLGLDIGMKDTLYILYIIKMGLNNPKKVKKKIKTFSYLIDKMIPDDELTKERMARLLFGVEKISYAFRSLLEIDDFNIITEIKKIAKEMLELYEKNPEDVEKIFQERKEELLSKIKNCKSIDVQTSIKILENLDILFNIEMENRDFIPLIPYSVKKEGGGK